MKIATYLFALVESWFLKDQFIFRHTWFDLIPSKTKYLLIWKKSILNSLGKNPDAIFKLLEEYQYEVYDYTGNSFNYKKDNCSKISDFIALVSWDN